MRDVYRTFQELSQCERAGIDYEIECVIRRKDIVVLAIHGGTMEKGTLELAKKVGEALHGTYYGFKCLKTEDPFELHVTSTNYDEEIARSLVYQSNVTISFHGAYSDECATYVGGRDQALARAVREELEPAFAINETPAHLKGVSPDNIVNDNERHQGLQLELTTPQYEQLQESEQRCQEFVQAVVEAVKRTM
ncbi:replication protein [Priestia megaterium]|nr:replication protein [Priestia megaterium]